MKQTVILTTTSLLSNVLLTIHITYDIVRGISKNCDFVNRIPLDAKSKIPTGVGRTSRPA